MRGASGNTHLPHDRALSSLQRTISQNIRGLSMDRTIIRHRRRAERERGFGYVRVDPPGFGGRAVGGFHGVRVVLAPFAEGAFHSQGEVGPLGGVEVGVY